MEAAAATTEATRRPAPGGTNGPGRAAAGGGSDRVTVVLFTLAAFLAVLALLAWQLGAASVRHRAAVTVLRRVYETTVVETVVGAGRAGSSVTQSTSSAGGSSAYSAAPATRSS